MSILSGRMLLLQIKCYAMPKHVANNKFYPNLLLTDHLFWCFIKI